MRSMQRLEGAAVSAVLLLLFATCVFVLIRNFGLYPIVFSDELSYSKFARLVSFEKASLPNYVYYLVYSSTSMCGGLYLDCSRFLNLAFYLASVPLIYLVGRSVAYRSVALFVGLVAFAGASNSYTAYFMPEAMYFFAFWLITWLVLRAETLNSLKDLLLIGTTVGVASLIKPHALFLLPGISAYFWYVTSGLSTDKAKRACLGITAIIGTALGVKMVLGFMMAGYSGLTLFGTFYAPYAESAASPGLDHYKSLSLHTAFSLMGHTLAICLIYGVPVACLASTILSSIARRTTPSNYSARERLSVYTLFIVTSLVIVSALFTASISDTTPGNHLHVRYYFFALPLLLVVATSGYNISNTSWRSRLIVALPVLAIILLALITRLSWYEVYSSTAPELYGVQSAGQMFNVIGVVALICLIAWVVAPRAGVVAYVLGYVPLMIVSSLWMVSVQISDRNVADDYDKAGVSAKAHLDQTSREQAVIVGDEGAVGGLFRTLFYLDTADLNYLTINASSSSIHGIPPSADFSVSELSGDKRYIIVIGNHQIIGDTRDIDCGTSYCLKQIIR